MVNLKMLPAVGLMFILITVTLGVGALVINGIRDNTLTTTSFAENITFLDADVDVVTHFPVIAVTSIVNATAPTTVYTSPAHYNITLLTGSITWGDIEPSAQVTYTYGAGDNTTAILNTGTESVSDLASWLPIIAVVIAAVLIIGLIVKGFAGGSSDL